MLWLQAEVVAMATDLAEFTGAAVGINLVFGLPLFPAGLITAVIAFVILGLEQRGYRRFELAIIALLALVGLGFAYLFVAAGGQHYHQLAAGLLPRLAGGDTLGLTVAIIGATVMPHVIYLHSALQANRVHAARQGEHRALLAGHQGSRQASPDHLYYADVTARIDANRAAISVARKLIRRAHHILRRLGDQAWSAVAA